MTAAGEPSLRGKRVLVTRPLSGAVALAERLEALGAEPITLPVVRLAPPNDWSPLDLALQRLRAGDYQRVIFTSANGVKFVWQRLNQLDVTGRDATSLFAEVKLAAIGPATEQALQERGLRVDYRPEKYVAEAIAEGLGPVHGERILLPRADIARKALADILSERGALVDEVVAYRTLSAHVDPEELDRVKALLADARIDVITFTSSSTVRHFFDLWEVEEAPQLVGCARIACIGPITADTVREFGLPVDIVADEHTIDGLIRAMERSLS